MEGGQLDVRFIDPRGKVFAHIGRVAQWREVPESGYRPPPVTVEWDLTNRCSLGCRDCHFAHTHVKGPWATKAKTLPMAHEACGDLADFHTVDNGLFDMAMAGVRAVVWSGGGEPTLHPRWQEIVTKADVYGLEQGMYTLGGHLTRESARLLAGVATWVVVSLDAADGDAYASEKGVPAARFDAACDGVRWLSGGPATIGVSFLLHEGNWFNAWDMLAFARLLGANYATFRPTVRVLMDKPSVPTGDRGWVTAAMPTLLRLAKEADVEVSPDRFTEWRDWSGHGYETCKGIRLSTTVSPDGRMWICGNRRGMSGSALGNLTHESFEAIWSRHPGQWTDFADCRASCRLHPINQTLAVLDAPRKHEAFL